MAPALPPGTRHTAPNISRAEGRGRRGREEEEREGAEERREGGRRRRGEREGGE